MSVLLAPVRGVRSVGLLVGIACLAASPVAAAADGPELDGSVSLVWYSLGDGSDSGREAAGADHRLLERVRLNARSLAPGLDFHSSFALRQWLGDDLDRDSQVRIQQAYLEGRGSGKWKGLRLLAGRHWRYGTGTTGLLDGVTASYRRGLVRLETFLGTRDWEDRDEVRWPDFDRSRWYGVSFGVRPLPWAEVAGGYDALRRDDVDDREMLTGTVDVRPVRPLRILGSVRFDMVRNYALDQRVRASWRPNGRREVWAEYAHRRPDLDPTSFLARFRDLLDADRREWRAGGRVSLHEVEVQADVLGVDHGEASPAAGTDPTWQAREPDAWSWETWTRLGWRGQSIGWYGGGGYGGERDGLLLSVGRQVHPKVRVGADANVLTYEYGRGMEEDEDLATLAVHAQAELDADTFVLAQVERLNNRVDNSDFRFLVRLRRGFRLGG